MAALEEINDDREELDGPLKQLKRQNEIDANRFMSRVFLTLCAIYLTVWGLNIGGVYSSGVSDASIMYFSCTGLCFTCSMIGVRQRGAGRGLKYMYLTASIFLAAALTAYSVYTTWAVFALPIAASCRYYSKKTTTITAVASMLALLPALMMGYYMGLRWGYLDVNGIVYSFLQDMGSGLTVELGPNLVDSMANAGVLPKGLIRAYMIRLCVTAYLFLTVVSLICIRTAERGTAFIMSISEVVMGKRKADIEAENARTRVMISQIQPHFLYNTLSAIMAIDGNPEETTDALADFGKYLRENLNVLTTTGNISFNREMEHVERYLALEKLRFGEKLNVIYDIQVRDFDLPPLTVQMLVENAVKHGITQREDGGTIWIRTSRNHGNYLIMVMDDGVGFDPESRSHDTEAHVGLNSVQSRIGQMAGGRLEINSKRGIGTVALVSIPAGGKK